MVTCVVAYKSPIPMIQDIMGVAEHTHHRYWYMSDINIDAQK